MTAAFWLNLHSDDGHIFQVQKYPDIGNLSNDFMSFYFARSAFKVQYYRNAINYLVNPFEIAILGPEMM
jgi:hypothetical protein